MQSVCCFSSRGSHTSSPCASTGDYTVVKMLLLFILSPGRAGNEHKFLGEGQTFRGKLIGVLEVPEARGDKMCQDAIQVHKGSTMKLVILHFSRHFRS